MISEDNTKLIVAVMKVTFLGSTPKVNNKARGGSYAITTVVPSMDTKALTEVVELINTTQCEVNIKRSGASMSITFK